VVREMVLGEKRTSLAGYFRPSNRSVMGVGFGRGKKGCSFFGEPSIYVGCMEAGKWGEGFHVCSLKRNVPPKRKKIMICVPGRWTSVWFLKKRDVAPRGGVEKGKKTLKLLTDGGKPKGKGGPNSPFQGQGNGGGKGSKGFGKKTSKKGTFGKGSNQGRVRIS